MKNTILLYGTLLATTALANPIAGQFCWLPGQGCSRAARSLDQLSSIHSKRAVGAQPDSCWLPGEACGKAATKRDPACWLPGEACGEAHAKRDAEAVRIFCSRSAQPCAKLKRVASAVADAMAVSETLPGPEDVNGTANHYCYGSGQPCALARRSALALAETMPLKRSTPFEEATEHHHFCWLMGQGCAKAKRDASAPSTPFQKATEHHHFCWLMGQGCAKAKRDALAAAEALADIEHEFTKRDFEYDATAAQDYCDSDSGPCSELKRFAAAVTDAIAKPTVAARALESEEDAEVEKRCYAAGGACDLGKRMVEDLEKMMANY